MNSSDYSFSKYEKLKSNKEISRVFSDGKFFYEGTLSAGIIRTNNLGQTNHKIAVLVPKKLFKSAVQRNKLKRLIRESYRLNKAVFYGDISQVKSYYNILFIYKNKTILPFINIETDLIKLLKKINAFKFTT